MSERVKDDALIAPTERLQHLFDSALQAARADGGVDVLDVGELGSRGENPIWVAVFFPVLAQDVDGCRGDGDAALMSAFAVGDVERSRVAVDVFWF